MSENYTPDELLENMATLSGANSKNKVIDSKKSLIIKIAIYAILWIVLFTTIPFSWNIERAINLPSFSFSSTLGEFSVHFVDVGQGDCTIIMLPDNKVVMIDTGPNSSRNNLKRYLSSMDFKAIDYLILTHPDEDHVGNAKMIFDDYEVLNCYVPKVSSNYMEHRGLNVNNYKLISTNVWSNLTEAMYNERCNIYYNFKNEKIYDDTYDYSIDFFTPIADYQSSSNDYSPIILVNIQDIKFMFTGDADESKEQEFLNEYDDLINSNSSYFDVDVLKVGHHGSKTSSKTEFLNVVKAETAIISCAAGNKYGHPNLETLERLEIANCEILRTDLTGSIVLAKNDDTSSTTKVSSKTNFNRNEDFYLEWKYVIIISSVLLITLAFAVFKRKRK